MKLTKKLIFISMLFSVGLSSMTWAGTLEQDFSAVAKNGKGSFGLNMFQLTNQRFSYQNNPAPGGYLFLSAYRNEKAQALVANHGFYTGNLFTTNYYDFMGQAIYEGSNSHPEDHGALYKAVASNGSLSSQLGLMTQHWVLEKYFVASYPEHRLSKGFLRVGVSGAEFEQEYAQYFFNLFGSVVSDDYLYLAGTLLAKKSPILPTDIIAEVRRRSDEVYEAFGKPQDLKKIRNAIHNALSEDVIGMIDDYLKKNPWYLKDGHTYLPIIKKLLIKYYSFDASEVAKMAKKAGLKAVESAALAIAKQGTNPKTLLSLSHAIAQLRGQMTDKSVVAYKSTAEAFALLVKSCAFISKEVNRIDDLGSKEASIALLNVIYAEGFLIHDNWEYFTQELKASSNSGEVQTILADVVEIGIGTLEEAFPKSLDQWVSVAPDEKMEKFIDDTVKSSTLNVASVLVNK